jgi:hypothetical protein
MLYSTTMKIQNLLKDYVHYTQAEGVIPIHRSQLDDRLSSIIAEELDNLHQISILSEIVDNSNIIDIDDINYIENDVIKYKEQILNSIYN